MDETLNIIQPQLSKQDYELRARGEVAISISCHNEFRHLYCIANISGNLYRLEKVGLLRPKIIVTHEDDKTPIGHYLYKRFGKPGLASIHGSQFQVQRSRGTFMSCTYEWINELGEHIMSYRVGYRMPKVNMGPEIKVRQDIYNNHDGLLIVAVGFYDYKTRLGRFS